MTDSENSQSQDDSDEDIYKDIPEFDFVEELDKLEGSKEIYKQEANELTKKVKVLTQENKELTKVNEVLKKNLSTLLKTAQAEVQRKDSVIEELRSKVESFIFRRNKKSTSDKFTSTEDLSTKPSMQQYSVKLKGSSERNRSKSCENWKSIDSEWRCSQDNEKKTILQPQKEENSSGNAQNTNFRYSESNRDTRNEKRKERKSSRYEDSSDHRRSFRENHRDHLLCDSYDKKRHSKSSDNRFLSRRRSSGERGHDSRRSESCERSKRSHRRGDSSERLRKRGSKKEKSRSQESKASSLEKPKSRFSRDNELIAWIREGIEAKLEVSKYGDGLENKRRTESIEKKINIEESIVGNGKNKQNQEKVPGKSDNRKHAEIFSIKSSLDALYNDMVASRSLSQFSNTKGGTVHSKSGPELFDSGNEFQNRNLVKEDWTLSFKNERQNETKPMTLYSRRMIQKFSLESQEKQLKKNSEGKEANEKTEFPTECISMEKLIQTEKEPGELTDDESVIESSREFQELTKVAAIESEIIKSPATEHFKDSFFITKIMKIEPSPKESQMALEKFIDDKAKSAAYKDIESKNDICDVIEFSPFKNNYKLIEISAIKPKGDGHILDFYSKKMLPANLPERSVAVDLSEEKTGLGKEKVGKLSDTSGEETSWRNSSSDNNKGSELEIVKPSLKGSSKEEETLARKEKESQKDEGKEGTKKGETKSMVSEEKTSFRRGKRTYSLKKGAEKSATDERTQKSKRKFEDEAEGKSDSKKLKLEKSEFPRKSIRSKRNPKSGSESQHFQEAEVKPRQEVENRVNEGILSCESFKPIAGSKIPETPVDCAINKCPSTDYKIAATMSVTGFVRLETPNKCMGKLKNLMINEQMIFNILDSKNNSQFSPLIGSKSIEMTPRRMLKNDLMLTDSEDDSINKGNALGEGIDEVEEQVDEEEEGEEESTFSGGECSDCGSDSGASNFVDLL